MIDLLVWRVMVAGAQEGKPDYLEVLVVAAAPVDLRPALNLAVEVAKLEDMVRRSAIPIRMRRLFPPTYAQFGEGALGTGSGTEEARAAGAPFPGPRGEQAAL